MDLLDSSSRYHRTRKVFILCNYVLLGCACSCIFLTLSLRLLPTLNGFSVILLHAFTIVGAVSGCLAAANPSRSSGWYATHMVYTVLTAIFQGAVAVLIFTRTSEFLQGINSYVLEEDGVTILRMSGGLCVAIFCMEWIVMGLAFAMRCYSCVAGEEVGSSFATKAHKGEELRKDCPWFSQV